MVPATLTLVQPDAVEQWVARISAAWRDSVGGIMEVAWKLKDAHEELRLQPGEWARLIGRGDHPQRLLQG